LGSGAGERNGEGNVNGGEGSERKTCLCDLGEGCFLALRGMYAGFSQLAASWVKKVGYRQLEFSNRQLHISDIGGYGLSEFQLSLKFPQMGRFPAQIL